MPLQYINTGSGANAGDGDTLRTAFSKINNNFVILSTSTASSSPTHPAWELTSSTKVVSLDSNGNLTLPLGAQISPIASGSVEIIAANTANSYASLTSANNGNYMWVDDEGAYVGLNWANSPKTWSWNTAGNLTASGGIIPNANLAYDLGSTSSQWRSLYVGTSTIYLGGTALSVSGGTITVDGNPVSGGGGASLGDRLTSSTYSVILEGTTGTVSVPNAIIGQSYQLILAGSQYSYDIGRYLRVRDGDVESHLHLDTFDNTLYDIILGDDGKYVKVDHTGTVVIGTNNNSKQWTFDISGMLTVPGTISGDGIFLNGDLTEGYAYLSLPNNANAATTSARIGNDNGNVQIVATNQTGPVVNYWTFGTNGSTTFPNNKIKTSADNSLVIETEFLPPEPPTTIVISGADFTAVNLTYNKDGANSIWYPALYNPATDPYIEFTGGQYGIFVPGFGQALYVNTGTLNVPLTQWNTNPPLGSVPPTGVYTYPNIYTRNWTFGTDGSITFPDGSTQTTAYGFVSPPVSSTSTGVAGSLAKDTSYFYVCTATNAWQRIAWDNTPW